MTPAQNQVKSDPCTEIKSVSIPHTEITSNSTTAQKPSTFRCPHKTKSVSARRQKPSHIRPPTQTKSTAVRMYDVLTRTRCISLLLHDCYAVYTDDVDNVLMILIAHLPEICCASVYVARDHRNKAKKRLDGRIQIQH